MPLLTFISDGGGILYTLGSGQLQLNHYNARGDVVATSDGSGNQTWRGQYDAFGAVDWETGFFLTRAPLGFVGGPNAYTYVIQNPWTKVDPDGQFWSLEITAAFQIADTYQYATSRISGKEFAGRTAKPNMSNDSIMYSLPGQVNGRAGAFEIDVRPSASENTETIMHRFFRPNP